MRILLAILLFLLPTVLHGQDAVQFDRPGLGMSPYALPWGDAALEFGLPDATWQNHRRTLTYDGTYRVGLSHGFELQAGAGGGDSLALKYAQNASAHVQWGSLITVGQGKRWGAVTAWNQGAWTTSAFLQIGQGYEAVGNASYALGNLSPYVEAGYVHDGFLGHSRVFGTGLAWMLSPVLQWDIQGRYFPTLHAWQAGWGLSFAF